MTVKCRILIFVIVLSVMILPVSSAFAALPGGLFTKDAEAGLKEAENVEEIYFYDDFKNGLSKWSTVYNMSVNLDGQLETKNDRAVCKAVTTTEFDIGNLVLEYDLAVSNPASNFMFVTDLRCKDKVDSVRIILYKDKITVIPVQSAGAGRQVYSAAVVEDDTMYRVRIRLVDDSLSYELKKIGENKFKKLFEMSGIQLTQKGQVSFLVSNAHTVIDNVEIVNLDNEELEFTSFYNEIVCNTTETLKLRNKTGEKVSFSSDNNEIATVDENGNVTANSKGDVFITAETPSGKTARCKVKSAVPVTNVVMHKNSMELEVGESEELLGYIVPRDATNSLIHWEVADPEIISLTGTRSTARGVTALKPGKTTITLTSDEGKFVSICDVIVKEKSIPDNKNAEIYFDGQKHKIPQYIYGNIETTTLYQASAGMLNMSRNIETEKINELYKMQLNKEMGFKTLRSYVHWYDWETGLPTNKTEDELKNLQPYPFEYYLENINEVEMPICMGINVNQDIEKSLRQIKKIKEMSNGRPFWIEYGNELYAISAQSIVANVDEYVKKLRELNRLVKEYDPDIKIGVPLLSLTADRAIKNDPNNWVRSKDDWEYTQGTRALEWNRTLAQNPDCYDAVIVHYYSGIHNFTDIKPKEVLRRHLTDVLMQGLSTEIMLKREFPGKEMWTTEYGVLSYNVQVGADTQERGRRQYCKSLGNAITYLTTFIEQLKNGTTLTNAASIIGGNGFEFYQTVGDENLLADRTLVTLPNGYLYEKFSPIINSSTHYYNLSHKDGSIYTEQMSLNGEIIDVLSPDILAYGFGDENGPNYALIVNQDENPTTVTIEGKEVAPLWKYEGKYGAYPYWTNNPNSDMADIPQHIDVPVDMNGSPQQSVDVAPFSIICVAVSGGIQDGISDELRSKLKDSVVVSSDASKAVGINGEIFYVDCYDYNTRTFEKDGQLYMPIRALLTNDNILLTYNSEEERVHTIRYDIDGESYDSSFCIGGKELMLDRHEKFPEGGGGVVYEGGKQVTLKSDIISVNGNTYLPLEAIALITQRNINEFSNGIYVLSKSDIVLTDEEIKILRDALVK